MSILDTALAAELTDALNAFDIPQSATVTRDENTGPDWDPVITPVDHACSGWIDNYSTIEHVDSSVLVNDRRVFVLCTSLDIAPTVNDRVTIGGTTHSIISVQRDPAGAAWVLQARA